MAVSTMFDTEKKYMVFLQVQEINLQSNIQGSKCDEYCIFLYELFRFTSFPSLVTLLLKNLTCPIHLPITIGKLTLKQLFPLFVSRILKLV